MGSILIYSYFGAIIGRTVRLPRPVVCHASPHRGNRPAALPVPRLEPIIRLMARYIMSQLDTLFGSVYAHLDLVLP